MRKKGVTRSEELPSRDQSDEEKFVMSEDVKRKNHGEVEVGGELKESRKLTCA